MLTAIEIENFKAFGERQRIELRPITMLFGPNSGGKSSVVHALHYLREILCERNIDAHRTWSGGDAIDLGGISNFVHNRMPGTAICLKAEFTVKGDELPDYQDRTENLDPDPEFPEDDYARSLITLASVEFEIMAADSPRLSRISVALNGQPFADFLIPQGKPHAEVRNINWIHPVFLKTDDDREAARETHKLRLLLREFEDKTNAKGVPNEETLNRLRELKDDEASLHMPGTLADLFDTSHGEDQVRALRDTIIAIPAPARLFPPLEKTLTVPMPWEADHDSQSRFAALLSMLLLGPLLALRERLKHFRYVGPLRAMPPRNAEPRNHSGRSRWPTGLAAWDSIAFQREETDRNADGSGALLEEVSKWLESEERLDTGYRLELETFKQVPTSVAAMITDPEYIDRLEKLAETIRALPEQSRVMLRDVGRNLPLHAQDVGVGLSQIVPILVALLEPKAPLVALEQPELHLHPRQQAALGDALICGMTAAPNRVLLIETHSEHLILRLLRRIRETSSNEAIETTQLRPSQITVVYIQPQGTNAVVTALPISDDGDFTQLWPNGFFAERVKELL